MVDLCKVIKKFYYNPYTYGSNSIKKVLPDFTIDYDPDFRQKIADSWPDSIDDQFARQQWNWKHRVDLGEMSKIMISNISKTVVSL